jgi:DsbC/DsbD-like thiol-disulfide interchange protein
VNFRIALFVVLLLFTGYGTVFSQETPIVTIIPSKQVTVAKGQTVQLSVRVKIKKGFHIQANPAADEFLIPATLTVQSSKGSVPGNPVYPPGQPYRLKGSQEDLLTYEDEVMIRLPVKVLDSSPLGNTNLTGGLRFQPCDDRRCFFPRSVPVMIPVKIVRPPK